MKLSEKIRKWPVRINTFPSNLTSICSVFCFVSMIFCLSGHVYAGKGFYSIQISSNKYLKSAESEVAKLTSSGYNAFYRYESIKGRGDWYKVYIGKYKSIEEARIIVDSLKDKVRVTESSIVTIADPNMQPPSSQTEKMYTLHVSSFQTPERAEKEVERLKELGMESFSRKENISGKDWYRVYMGQFSDKAAADKRGFELKQASAISFYKISHQEKPVSDIGKPADISIQEPETTTEEITGPDESGPAISETDETYQESTPPVDIQPSPEEEKGQTLKEKYLKDMEEKEKQKRKKRLT